MFLVVVVGDVDAVVGGCVDSVVGGKLLGNSLVEPVDKLVRSLDAPEEPVERLVKSPDTVVRSADSIAPSKTKNIKQVSFCCILRNVLRF